HLRQDFEDAQFHSLPSLYGMPNRPIWIIPFSCGGQMCRLSIRADPAIQCASVVPTSAPVAAWLKCTLKESPFSERVHPNTYSPGASATPPTRTGACTIR